jgi:hypothetical protein
MKRRLFLLSAMLLSGCMKFVALPPGEISREADGPTDEIILYLAFDPALVPPNEIPTGIRFRSLEETAQKDADVARYVRDHPERANWTSSFLEIMRPGWLEFDGIRYRLEKDEAWAIWYAYAAREDKTDTRPLGSQILELGTWLPNERLVEQTRAKGYPFDLGRAHFVYENPDRVVASLETPTLKVNATVALSGKPHPPWWKLPGVQTIWNRRGSAAAFEIVTYNGHRMRDATGTWQIEGTDLLAKAFANRLSGATHVDTTEYAAGYRIRGALYR